MTRRENVKVFESKAPSVRMRESGWTPKSEKKVGWILSWSGRIKVMKGGVEESKVRVTISYSGSSKGGNW